MSVDVADDMGGMKRRALAFVALGVKRRYTSRVSRTRISEIGWVPCALSEIVQCGDCQSSMAQPSMNGPLET